MVWGEGGGRAILRIPSEQAGLMGRLAGGVREDLR